MMRELIATLPDQLRWAARLAPVPLDAAGEGLVLGMGGSGFAGDVAAAFADAQGRRVAAHKGYGLPGWARGRSLAVVGVSHSGNTEETLSGVQAAVDGGMVVATAATGGALQALAAGAGLPHVAVPPGPQPRAAAGYLAGSVLRLLESAGVVSDAVPALDEAADVVAAVLGGDGPGIAAEIAAGLAGRVAIVYGSGPLTAAAAGRWKTQLNENGKVPAWWSVLPELDHNEIVGWTAGVGTDAVAVVFLQDAGDHPRVQRRAALTAELMSGVRIAGRPASRGSGVLARLFSLVALGDLVSVEVAERAGIDPVPVDVIERLKRRLAE